MLVQCAWPAKRQKNSYYMAQFYRLQTRRGPQKAICAVAASILTAIYHMLKNGTRHHDLGADHFDRRSPEAKAKRLLASFRDSASRLHFNPPQRPPDITMRRTPSRGFLRGAERRSNLSRAWHRWNEIASLRSQ
jgi:hypothetical protein